MKKMIITIAFLAFSLMLTASTQQSSNVVNVYYFHGEFRCVTCTKMEAMIVDVVKTFENEIKANKLKFQIVNFDEKENEKYVKAYDLFNQTLIISLSKHGKEVKWKSAEKIWQLNRKERDFKNYVIKEIRDYLREI